MKTKLSGIRPSPWQLYIQWIRKDWSKTSLSSVILLPDLTWRPIFTRCCKDLNCVQTSVASLRIISVLLSWNVQVLPASTLHRNPLSFPYLYFPHGISEKKIKASCRTYPSFPMAEIQSLHSQCSSYFGWIFPYPAAAAAAAAKSLQSCLTLWDPRDGSPPGSPVPGILQTRTLEWVTISFSNAWKWKVKVKSLSCVRLLATPWTAAYQAHTLASAIPGGYGTILGDVMSVLEVGHSLSWTTEKPEPGAMQIQAFIFFF